MSCLHVHFLPSLVEPEALRGSTVVVIDVLRATTTIAAAIAAGAREVIPCGEVDEARAVAARFAKGEVLLGGERGGLKIPGFDLGNSPSEYTPERVGGKSVVFTTTNGTQAFLRCRQAGRVVTAGFVNLSAVVAAIQDAKRIDLLCAGTRALITGEDVLLAGCFVHRLLRHLSALPGVTGLNDSADIAFNAVPSTGTNAIMNASGRLVEEAIGAALMYSQGGCDLMALGLTADIFDAAKVDRWSCVPELDIARWSIRDNT